MTETIACANCGRSFNVKMRVCPHCGVEHLRQVVNTVPVCPACNCVMEGKDYRGNRVDRCPQCGSLWVHGREFKKLTSERDIFCDNSIPDEYIRTPPKRLETYFHCPVCGVYMVQRNFQKFSGIIIDICRDHGIWMEAGELERIRCFIASGGLEEAQDREILMNREAINSLDTRLSDVEFMQKLLHHWNLKRWLFS